MKLIVEMVRKGKNMKRKVRRTVLTHLRPHFHAEVLDGILRLNVEREPGEREHSRLVGLEAEKVGDPLRELCREKE